MREGFFTHEFLVSLPSDNLEAIVKLYNEFKRLQASYPDNQLRLPQTSPSVGQHHDDLVESLAIFQAFFGQRHLSFECPSVGPDKRQNVQNALNAIHSLGTAWSVELAKRSTVSFFTDKNNHYTALFGGEEYYLFADDELKRIQELVNELRGLISASNLISADHKRRLLRRLEAMQSEIHKRSSDIERFWGFIAESGIVARKYGEDLKPITDRVTEMGKIIIAVVLAKEGVKALPDITKLLGH